MVTNLVRNLTAQGYAFLFFLRTIPFVVWIRSRARLYALVNAFKYDVPFVMIQAHVNGVNLLRWVRYVEETQDEDR